MFVFAYITVPNARMAAQISRLLIQGKLAACTNTFPKMHAMYRWKGRIETATELVVIAKTEKRKAQKVIQAVESIHPYEVPCIVFLPVISGNKKYLNWLSTEMGARPRKKR